MSLLQFGRNDFEITRREVPYQGLFFRIARYQIRHHLFQGGMCEPYQREVLERLSAAAVLPYDPLRDRVILIEQFRIGSIADAISPWLIEIPAGVLANEEKPEDLARHEAEEEAGCTIIELHPIHEFYVSAGGSNEYLNVYCGKIDSAKVGGVHGLENENENIRVHNIPFDEAIKRLQAGEIKTSPAIIALLWLQLNREKLREQWLD